jgi:hypothetical protein
MRKTTVVKNKKMTKKTYTVSITYVGEVEVEDEDELKESLYVVHTGIFGEPYDGFPLEAEQVEIEEVEE